MRVLNSDLSPPYIGGFGQELFQSFGFGPLRGYMAGLPHFRDSEFEGTYPIAKIRFIDEDFPGRVEMVAFNPFIPLNDLDSSIPAAFFKIRVENPTDREIVYTVCLSVQNPLPAGTTINKYEIHDRYHLIKMFSTKIQEDDPSYGDLTVATDASDVSYQEYWFRGKWFDSLQVYWKDLTVPGRLKNRFYQSPQEGIKDHASLATHMRVKSRESESVRFIISWSFPNCYNYWNTEKNREASSMEELLR